jgi:ADP-heptose:LPS heptosyltransferase
LAEQLDQVEIHYLTKKSYAQILEANPHISKLHVLDSNWSALMKKLRSEKFDVIIDLHKNLRTFRLALDLKVKRFTFNKLNFQKWMMVRFKINRLPRVHIVDRYLMAAKPLGIMNDHKGLEYYIPANLRNQYIQDQPQHEYLVIAIGGQHETKKLPKEQLASLIDKINGQIVLLGGKEDQAIGAFLGNDRDNVHNYCGKLSLHESAVIIKDALALVSHDTGLMHIGAAFNKPILSIWGNTIPAFGMYPYLTDENSKTFELQNLSCRPCSKIGFEKCPKGHFNCMKMQNLDGIATHAMGLFGKDE